MEEIELGHGFARVLLDQHAGFMNNLQIDDAVGDGYAHFTRKNNRHC